MRSITALVIGALLLIEVTHATRSKLLDEKTPLIVGGANAPKERYPWQALLYYNDRFRCGGSLVSTSFVLTAAHCIRDDVLQRWGSFKIAVGKYKLMKRDSFEQYRYIKKVHMHLDYNPALDQHDIAFLELSHPVNISSRVNPVILATSRFDLMATKWMDCFATGFGLVSSDQPKLANTLQELKTYFISKMACKSMAHRLYNARETITKIATCTQDENAGVCNGDSGGPVGCFDKMGTYVQIGLLSWGSQYCPDGFNVFMRVSQYRKWMKGIAGKLMFMEPWEMSNSTLT